MSAQLLRNRLVRSLRALFAAALAGQSELDGFGRGEVDFERLDLLKEALDGDEVRETVKAVMWMVKKGHVPGLAFGLDAFLKGMDLYLESPEAGQMVTRGHVFIRRGEKAKEEEGNAAATQKPKATTPTSAARVIKTGSSSTADAEMAELRRRAAEVESMAEELAEVRRELARVEASLASSKKEAGRGEAESERLKERLQAADEEMQRLRERMRVAEAATAEATTLQAHSKAEAERLRGRIQEIEGRLRASEEGVADMQALRTRLRTAEAEAGKVQGLRERLERADAELDAMSKAKAQSTAEGQGLQERLRAVEEELSESVTLRGHSEAEAQGLRSKVQALESELKDIKDKTVAVEVPEARDAAEARVRERLATCERLLDVGVADLAAKLGLELRLQRDAESIAALRRRVADLEVSWDNSAGARLRHDQIRMHRTRITVLEAEVDLLKRIGGEKDAQLKEYQDVHGYYADRLAKIPGMQSERDEARAEARRAHDAVRLLKRQLSEAGFAAWELGGDVGGPFAELHVSDSISPHRIASGSPRARFGSPRSAGSPRYASARSPSPRRKPPLDTGPHKSPRSPRTRPKSSGPYYNEW